MPRELRPCGTNAAYIRHIRKGEKPCEPCRQAHLRDNRRKWHIASAKVKGRYKRRRTIRYQAVKDLIRAHQDEFYGLMDDIRASGHPGGDVRNEAIRRLIASYPKEFERYRETARQWAEVFDEFTEEQ